MNLPIFICQPPSYGAYVRLIRAKYGLRQSELAKLAGIPQSYVSAAERDKYVIWWAKDALDKALKVFEEDKE